MLGPTDCLSSTRLYLLRLVLYLVQFSTVRPAQCSYCTLLLHLGTLIIFISEAAAAQLGSRAKHHSPTFLPKCASGTLSQVRNPMPSKGVDPTTYILKRQNILLASKLVQLKTEQSRAEQASHRATKHAVRLQVLVDALAAFSRSILLSVTSTVEGGDDSGLCPAFDRALEKCKAMSACVVGSSAEQKADGEPFRVAVQAALQEWHEALFQSKLLSRAWSESSDRKQVRLFASRNLLGSLTLATFFSDAATFLSVPLLCLLLH